MLRRLLRFAAGCCIGLVGLLGLVGLGAAASVQPARWALAGATVFHHAAMPALGGADAILRDRAGFVWVGTQDGLVRWDGYRARRFRAEPGVAGALPDNFVRALHLDADGQLWVGTASGGLARYDAQQDRFERLPEAGVEIGAIAADATGQGFWIGSGRVVLHVDPRSASLRRVGDAGGVVAALLHDADGTLWAGTRAGLARRSAAAGSFSPLRLPSPDGVEPSVAALHRDRSARLWIGTRLRGAYVVDAGAVQPRAVHEGGSELASDTVRAIVEARAGEVWLGTYGNGIVRLTGDGRRAQRERHDKRHGTTLVDDTITALHRDADGQVWVGSNYALSRHDPAQDSVVTLLGGAEQPIRSASVPAVLALRDGRLWLAAGEFGAEIVDPVRGSVAQLVADARHADRALPKARVIALAQGPEDRVWIGTQAGLYHAAPDGSGLTRVDLAPRRVNAETWALAFDGQRLWLGGPDGVWLVDTAAARPRPLRHFDAGVAEARVTALARGGDGSLWVGTTRGLARLDATAAAHEGDGIEGQPAVPLTPDARDPAALSGGFVSALLIDRRQRLWVASFGRGLLVESGRDDVGRPRFRHLGTRQGLPHEGVDALLQDGEGHVWASTDDGLARIDATTLDVRALRAAQGVGVLGYWSGSATTTPAGELVFGGQGGIVVVRPERYAARPGAAALAVTEASIGGEAVPPARLASGQPIEVAANDRRLMVEFAALDFRDSERRRYAYRLVGFDDGWVETPASRRLASYTNLPPGDYQLQLASALPGGDWSAPLVLPLRVVPRLHEQPAVQAATALAALALLAALVHLRTLVLRRRQRRLEALVAERTAELERRTAELRASQQRLEQLAYFDALTGLANRRLFGEELRRLSALSERGGDSFALALVDLDRFKEVNDAHGHDAGDALLRIVAVRLQATVRESDRVARLGGDEFAVLLSPGGDGNELAALCQRIVAAMALPVDLAGSGCVGIGASVGLALCPQHAVSAEALYKCADIALYDAKRAGRGTWRLFEWSQTCSSSS